MPTGLTALGRSDHRIDLAWSWPTDGSTPPDYVQVWRDGSDVVSLPASATSYSDTVPSPGTTYTYQLVTVTSGVPTTPEPSPGVSATTRLDAANPPTNVAAAFAPGTDNATVTWTRGAQDADVTYDVTAQQVGGGVVSTWTGRYPNDGTAGSATITGLASYTSYVFSVSAVEDANDPPGDPGGTVPAAATATALSSDTIPPSFNGGSLSASRTSLGTITLSWPSATDAGSGVDHYHVCVDTTTCTDVAFNALATSQSATPGAPNIPNDGGAHTVSVVAVDQQGNQSAPLTASPVVMPVPATPTIALSGGDGCSPLVATESSADGATAGLAYHLFIDGAPSDSLLGQPITSGYQPYQLVTLTGQAYYGGDMSAVSPPLQARVYDPAGPPASPQVHSQTDPPSSTDALSWNPVTSDGAPIDGYQVTSTNIPGYGGAGVFVPQSSTPGLTLAGLSQSENYVAYVASVDHCGRTSTPVSTTVFRLDDDDPPTAPGLNQPTATGNSVHLSWTASTDNVQVDDYKVYRGSTLVGRTPGLTFDDLGLPDATTFSYSVVAIDTAGNPSAKSVTRTVTTKDTTPPTPPGAVRIVSMNGGTVTLAWAAAGDNVGVTGYQVTRVSVAPATATASSFSLATIAGTTYTDKNVPAGDWTWVVRAVDAAGNVGTPRSTSPTQTYGSPKATAASTLRLVKSNGKKTFVVGGKSGARIMLSFKLTQTFAPAVLRLRVLGGKAKVRVSLPAGSGRSTPGRRLGERHAKKGVLEVPLGTQKKGTLRLVVTAQGGPVTVVGTGGAMSKSPTIIPKP